MIRIKRWAKLDDFNPGSSKQILAYLKYQGYEIPRDRKTRKPTTNKEAMAKLLEQHPNDPLLQRLGDVKKVKKAVGDLKDANLGADDRFHSIIAMEPDTGRLSGKRPNLMNQQQGREGPLAAWIAKKIRSTIIPDDGFLLMEPDWRAIEAVLTGWFAGDEDYIRLSLMDSHGFYTSHLLAKLWKKIPKPFEMNDPDLESKLHWLKKTFPTDRAIGKMINLATGYGMAWRHLAAKANCSEDEAKAFLQIKDDMAPKVTAWKKSVWLQAHNEGLLTNPFGYARAFSHVLRKNAAGKWVPDSGGEANKALAFLPQSTAAAMLRETLVALYEVLQSDSRSEKLAMLMPVHDAILMQVARDAVDWAIELVRPLFEKPWAELNGLSISAEFKVGVNWAEMAVEDD